MRLELINTDSISEGLPEITFPRIFENRRFSKNGLFSQQIFGPVKSYSCACNRQQYKGPRYEHKRCASCKVDIIKSDVRKKRFAKIKLPFPVMNPLCFYLIVGNRSSLRKILSDMLYYKAKYYFDSEHKLMRVLDSDPDPEDTHVMCGLNGVLEYLDHSLGTDEIILPENELLEDIEEQEPVKLRCELQFVKDHLDILTLNNVLVIPPEYRPCTKGSNANYIADDINEKYHKIIKMSNELKSVPYDLVTQDDDIYRTNYKYLQKLIFELYEYLLDRMSKKSGLIRSNILGKRVDFSGRAVISPDPTLKLTECRLPYWMVLEILKPQLIAHFVNRRVCKRYNQAIQKIDESIQNSDLQYFDIVEEYCNDLVCVINRQPTLHRLSVLAFKVKIHKGNTIQMHPMTCSAYNSDYDGDCMAIYMPVTSEAKQDVIEKLGIWNNLLSPTDIETVPKPNQDIILGIYTATKE